MGQTVTLSDLYLFSNHAGTYYNGIKNNSETTQLLFHINIASSSLDKIFLREIAKLLKACFSYISHGHASNTHVTVPSNFKSPMWKHLQVQPRSTAGVLLFWCFNYVTSHSRTKFDISTESHKLPL